jgi:HAD superfamily hydrolase (TIGR01509 family)
MKSSGLIIIWFFPVWMNLSFYLCLSIPTSSKFRNLLVSLNLSLYQPCITLKIYQPTKSFQPSTLPFTCSLPSYVTTLLSLPHNIMNVVLFVSGTTLSLLTIRKRITRSKPQPVGFLFDLDGTLLDFEGSSHDALNAPLQRFNKTVEWALHASIVGKPKTAWTTEILKAVDIGQEEYHPDVYADEWHEHIIRDFPNMKLLPGALELVEKIRKEFPHARLAIATSSERINFDLKMAYHPRLLKCFDAVVTGNEVQKGKPNPDIFLEAAKRIQVDASRCVVFEDSPSGVLGGKRAGSLVVAIPDKRMVGIEKQFDIADIVVNSLVELSDHMLKSLHERLNM